MMIQSESGTVVYRAIVFELWGSVVSYEYPTCFFGLVRRGLPRVVIFLDEDNHLYMSTHASAEVVKKMAQALTVVWESEYGQLPKVGTRFRMKFGKFTRTAQSPDQTTSGVALLGFV